MVLENQQVVMQLQILDLRLSILLYVCIANLAVYYDTHVCT